MPCRRSACRNWQRCLIPKSHPAFHGADGPGPGCRGKIPEVAHPVRWAIHTHDGPHELVVRRSEYQCVSPGHIV